MDEIALPQIVRSSLSEQAQKILSATIREYQNYPRPQLGDEAYSAQRRITGYESGLNYYSSFGFYNSWDVPLNVLDSMRRDYQVALGLSIVKYPITNLGFTVTCDNEVQRDFVAHVMKKIWWDTLRSFLLAIDYGFVGLEKVWENVRYDIDPGLNQRKLKGRSFIVLKKVKPLHPRTVRLVVDQYGNFVRLNQRVSNVSDLVKLAPNKSMLITYNKEFGNLFGRSRMIPAYEAWYWKVISTQFFLRWMERQSIPPYKIQYPKGISKISTDGAQRSNQDIAMDLAQILSSYGNVAIPSELYDESKLPKWNIEGISSGRQNNRLNLKEVLEDVWNTAILRGLLIPDANSLGGLTETTADQVFLSSLGDFVKQIEEAINNDIIQPMLHWNFPKDEIASCRLNIDDIDFQKRQEMRKLLSKILDVSSTFVKQTGKLPFKFFPDMEKILNILDIPKMPVALYDLKRFDPMGKDITKEVMAEQEKMKKQMEKDAKKTAQGVDPNAAKGPDKGEKTPGNVSRTGHNGTPRDEDKKDQSVD